MLLEPAGVDGSATSGGRAKAFMGFVVTAFVVFKPDVLLRIPFVIPYNLSCRLDYMKLSIYL